MNGRIWTGTAKPTESRPVPVPTLMMPDGLAALISGCHSSALGAGVMPVRFPTDLRIQAPNWRLRAADFGWSRVTNAPVSVASGSCGSPRLTACPSNNATGSNPRIVDCDSRSWIFCPNELACRMCCSNSCDSLAVRSRPAAAKERFPYCSAGEVQNRAFEDAHQMRFRAYPALHPKMTHCTARLSRPKRGLSTPSGLVAVDEFCITRLAPSMPASPSRIEAANADGPACLAGRHLNSWAAHIIQRRRSRCALKLPGENRANDKVARTTPRRHHSFVVVPRSHSIGLRSSQ